jgi:hypothetical protein
MTSSNLRKCSPLAAVAAGAAMCLSSGTAHAVSGSVGASNTAQTFSYFNKVVNLFGGKASFGIEQTYSPTAGTSGGYYYGPMRLKAGVGSPLFNATGGSYVNLHDQGVVVSAGLANGFQNSLEVPPGIVNQYLAVKFVDAGEDRFGWVNLNQSTVEPNPGGLSANTLTISLSDWSYNDTGGSIQTLANPLSLKTLPLANGATQLHWSNPNESGVASYTLQRQLNGSWETVQTDTPQTGHYTAPATAGTSYRVLVEQVDGTIQTTNF